jgi:peptidyl-prolyl cis-trans isomerase C
MKHLVVSFALFTATAAGTLSLSAQAPAPAAGAPAVVAVVNGEPITKEMIDGLWARLSPKMKFDYERGGGGKEGFLRNQIDKLLVLQEARKAGFDKNAAVRVQMAAASESALFDAFVRDTIASTVVTEAMLQKFYEDNLPDFTSEQAKVRIIRIAKGVNPDEAREKLGVVMTSLIQARTELASKGIAPRELKETFSRLAKSVSDDPSADVGGELGWVERGRLPESLAGPIFGMPLETISGILDTGDSFSLVYLEERGNRTETLDEVRDTLREFLLGQKQNQQRVIDVLNKKTQTLRSSAKIELFSQNLD